MFNYSFTFIKTFDLLILEKILLGLIYLVPLISSFYIFTLMYLNVNDQPKVGIINAGTTYLFERLMYRDRELIANMVCDFVFSLYFFILILLLLLVTIKQNWFFMTGLETLDSIFNASYLQRWYELVPSMSSDSTISFQVNNTEIYYPEFLKEVSLSNLALWLLVLTFFIIYYSYYYVRNTSENQFRRVELYSCLFFLLGTITIVFLTDNILVFYISFEATLIPMFYMILRFGSRSRKSLASNYIFLYTIAGSLLFLIVIIVLYGIYGSLNIPVLVNSIANDYEFRTSDLYWILATFMFIAFSVKIPMMPFHIWLPEAHVEAPTVGSVVLAGLLLKLGSFGFIKIFIPLFPTFVYSFSYVFLCLFIISSVYASLMVLTQDDIKKAIAYASISHMNGAMLGLFSLTKVGKCATFFYMIGHGFISSGLFFLIGMLYTRFGSRDIKDFGGLASRMPIYSAVSLIFWLSNMGFPGTVNFLSEFFVLISLVQVSVNLVFLLFLSLIVSAVYSIWMFSKINFGSIVPSVKNFYDLTYTEFTVLLMLIIFIVVLGLLPGLVINMCSLNF